MILYLSCGCSSSGSFSHIRKQVMRSFEDSYPLKHAGNTETLLFVAPDIPTSHLPIWPTYAYSFLVGLFNTAVPPTEIMSHPLIYLYIYNLLNTWKTKIQRFRSYITENKMCFRWEDRLVYVVQENSRSCCRNHTTYTNTTCGSKAKVFSVKPGSTNSNHQGITKFSVAQDC
jgi:hypothetical protein